MFCSHAKTIEVKEGTVLEFREGAFDRTVQYVARKTFPVCVKCRRLPLGRDFMDAVVMACYALAAGLAVAWLVWLAIPS